MSYEISYENDGAMVRTTYMGDVEAAEVGQAVRERYADKRFRAVRIMVADFSEASMRNIQADDTRSQARRTEEMAEINGDLDYVLIVPNDLDYGMTRMWQAYVDDIPWRTHLTRSREEAESLIESLLDKRP